MKDLSKAAREGLTLLRDMTCKHSHMSGTVLEISSPKTTHFAMSSSDGGSTRVLRSHLVPLWWNEVRLKLLAAQVHLTPLTITAVCLTFKPPGCSHVGFRVTIHRVSVTGT